MDLSEICERYDELLDTEAYADVDASANGLQVGPSEASVDRVAFAVDAAESTIETAVDRGADLFVAHHGILWGEADRVTDTRYRRIAPLIEHGIALYVSHLPLDGHQELGNAAGVADLLDLEDREPFGEMGPVHIGQRGRAPDPIDLQRLVDRLEEALDTGGQPVRTLAFGPDRIEDVAIVTGSGVDWLHEGVAAGVDAFVTGEGKQEVYHEAKEAGINVVLAGHYATETFGVAALRDRAEEWGLETTFIDEPTGI